MDNEPTPTAKKIQPGRRDFWVTNPLSVKKDLGRVFLEETKQTQDTKKEPATMTEKNCKDLDKENGQNSDLFERIGKLAGEYESLHKKSEGLIEDLKKGGFPAVSLLLSQMQLTESLQMCFMAELLTDKKH